jgi:predicted short-subunit dehydrogenase-like oxidoreductase (DUF2520 family)
MRQVPQQYGVVGNGRLAKNLIRYLELKGETFVSWNRKQDVEIQTLKDCNVILLCVTDGAIADLASEIRSFSSAKLVHFSGALSLDGVFSFHPLMTFTGKLHNLGFYESIPFIVEGDLQNFNLIFPSFENPVLQISREQKPLYHALCVAAGNFPQMIWSEVFELFEKKLGIPKESIFGLLIQSLNNSLELGPSAETGPIGRMDFDTINKNKLALQGTRLEKIYPAFEEGFSPLNRRPRNEISN